MSIVPPRTSSSGAAIRWTDFLQSRQNSGLEGKVVTLEQLREKFGPKATTGKETLGAIVELKDGKYTAYARPVLSEGSIIMHEYIAYQCDTGCKKIIVGPPRFEDENTIGPLAGCKGYDAICKECNHTLDSITYKMSLS